MEDPSEEWSCFDDMNKNAPEDSENTVEDVSKVVEPQPSDTTTALSGNQSGKNGGTTSKSKSGQNRNRNKKDKSDEKAENGQKQVC